MHSYGMEAKKEDIDPQLERGAVVYDNALLKKYKVDEVIPESQGRLKAYRLVEVTPHPVQARDLIAAIFLLRFYTPDIATAAA